MLKFVLISIVLASSAAFAAPFGGPLGNRCGTPELLREYAGSPRRPPTVPVHHGGPKLERDAFGSGYIQVNTENFAIKWRDDSVTLTEALAAGAALELAWSFYIDQLGHEPCTGCETYLVNVYLHRAEDAPSIDFPGGFAALDAEAYPFMVIQRALLGTTSVEMVAVHELYHVLQFSTGAFKNAPWFWEATAEWATQQVLPSQGYGWSGSLALRSELPIYYAGNAANIVEETHKYGASIFFRYVTDKLQAPSIIVNAWEQSTADDEPLATVAALLPASDLATLYAEFTARNAIWDYPYRQFIIESISVVRSAFPELSELAGVVPPEGVGMTPLARSPYGFGYAIVELRRPPTGRFEIEVQMTPPAVPAALHGTVVHGEPGAATYTALEIDGTTGTLVMDVPESAVRLYLVLAVTTDERTTGAPIPLSYRVTPVEPVEPPGDAQAGGCCQTGSSPTGTALLISIVVLALRPARSRRAGRPSPQAR